MHDVYGELCPLGFIKWHYTHANQKLKLKIEKPLNELISLPVSGWFWRDAVCDRPGSPVWDKLVTNPVSGIQVSMMRFSLSVKVFKTITCCQASAASLILQRECVKYTEAPERCSRQASTCYAMMPMVDNVEQFDISASAEQPKSCFAMHPPACKSLFRRQDLWDAPTTDPPGYHSDNHLHLD